MMVNAIIGIIAEGLIKKVAAVTIPFSIENTILKKKPLVSFAAIIVQKIIIDTKGRTQASVYGTMIVGKRNKNAQWNRIQTLKFFLLL